MLAVEGGTAPRELTVLLVEDEVLTRLMLADELRSQGLQVLEASNADEALTVLQSSLLVHLLFTDIRMPGEMDGVALAKFAHARFPGSRASSVPAASPNRSATLPTLSSPSLTTCANWSRAACGFSAISAARMDRPSGGGEELSISIRACCSGVIRETGIS